LRISGRFASRKEEVFDEARRGSTVRGPRNRPRKLLELAAGIEAIDGRIRIEKINAPFLSQDGCEASGAEFVAHLRYAVERGWLDLLHGTYVELLPLGNALLKS